MAQFSRPSSDQATGSWSATPLWSKIDDAVASADGTTISSDDNTSPDNADLQLSSVTDPQSSEGHIIRALWNKDASGGHTINAVCELWEGVPGTGTLRATLSSSGIGSTPATDSYTLSTAEADAISDYGNLYFRVSRQGDTGGNPNGRRSLVVDAVELEVPDVNTDRAGRASWSELEVPDAPRAGRASWAEIEVPDAPRSGRIAWGELEAPTAPRAGRLSWAELETSDAPRAGRVSWAEMEAPSSTRSGRVSWSELEVPTAPRAGRISWAEGEVPDAPRSGCISWAEIEVPSVGEIEEYRKPTMDGMGFGSGFGF